MTDGVSLFLDGVKMERTHVRCYAGNCARNGDATTVGLNLFWDGLARSATVCAAPVAARGDGKRVLN